MAEEQGDDVTALLVAWGTGDTGARDRLLPLVYAELHALAHRRIRGEQPGGTLQTTALVHEAYLRLVHGDGVSWTDRAHFFAVCARVMRRILVDQARARESAKRGGGAKPVVLDANVAGRAASDADVLAVNEALTRLAALDSRRSEVVELRYFGGLTVEETATALGISAETVARDWRAAKLWLFHELTAGTAGE